MMSTPNRDDILSSSPSAEVDLFATGEASPIGTSTIYGNDSGVNPPLNATATIITTSATAAEYTAITTTSTINNASAAAINSTTNAFISPLLVNPSAAMMVPPTQQQQQHEEQQQRRSDGGVGAGAEASSSPSTTLLLTALSPEEKQICGDEDADDNAAADDEEGNGGDEERDNTLVLTADEEGKAAKEVVGAEVNVGVGAATSQPDANGGTADGGALGNGRESAASATAASSEELLAQQQQPSHTQAEEDEQDKAVAPPPPPPPLTPSSIPNLTAAQRATIIHALRTRHLNAVHSIDANLYLREAFITVLSYVVHYCGNVLKEEELLCWGAVAALGATKRKSAAAAKMAMLGSHQQQQTPNASSSSADTSVVVSNGYAQSLLLRLFIRKPRYFSVNVLRMDFSGGGGGRGGGGDDDDDDNGGNGGGSIFSPVGGGADAGGGSGDDEDGEGEGNDMTNTALLNKALRSVESILSSASPSDGGKAFPPAFMEATAMPSVRVLGNGITIDVVSAIEDILKFQQRHQQQKEGAEAEGEDNSTNHNLPASSPSSLSSSLCQQQWKLIKVMDGGELFAEAKQLFAAIDAKYEPLIWRATANAAAVAANAAATVTAAPKPKGKLSSATSAATAAKKSSSTTPSTKNAALLAAATNNSDNTNAQNHIANIRYDQQKEKIAALRQLIGHRSVASANDLKDLCRALYTAAATAAAADNATSNVNANVGGGDVVSPTTAATAGKKRAREEAQQVAAAAGTPQQQSNSVIGGGGGGGVSAMFSTKERCLAFICHQIDLANHRDQLQQQQHLTNGDGDEAASSSAVDTNPNSSSSFEGRFASVWDTFIGRIVALTPETKHYLTTLYQLFDMINHFDPRRALDQHVSSQHSSSTSAHSGGHSAGTPGARANQMANTVGVGGVVGGGALGSSTGGGGGLGGGGAGPSSSATASLPRSIFGSGSAPISAGEVSALHLFGGVPLSHLTVPPPPPPPAPPTPILPTAGSASSKAAAMAAADAAALAAVNSSPCANLIPHLTPALVARRGPALKCWYACQGPLLNDRILFSDRTPQSLLSPSSTNSSSSTSSSFPSLTLVENYFDLAFSKAASNSSSGVTSAVMAGKIGAITCPARNDLPKRVVLQLRKMDSSSSSMKEEKRKLRPKRRIEEAGSAVAASSATSGALPVAALPSATAANANAGPSSSSSSSCEAVVVREHRCVTMLFPPQVDDPPLRPEYSDAADSDDDGYDIAREDSDGEDEAEDDDDALYAARTYNLPNFYIFSCRDALDLYLEGAAVLNDLVAAVVLNATTMSTAAPTPTTAAAGGGGGGGDAGGGNSKGGAKNNGATSSNASANTNTNAATSAPITFVPLKRDKEGYVVPMHKKVLCGLREAARLQRLHQLWWWARRMRNGGGGGSSSKFTAALSAAAAAGDGAPTRRTWGGDGNDHDDGSVVDDGHHYYGGPCGPFEEDFPVSLFPPQHPSSTFPSSSSHSSTSSTSTKPLLEDVIMSMGPSSAAVEAALLPLTPCHVWLRCAEFVYPLLESSKEYEAANEWLERLLTECPLYGIVMPNYGKIVRPLVHELRELMVGTVSSNSSRSVRTGGGGGGKQSSSSPPMPLMATRLAAALGVVLPSSSSASSAASKPINSMTANTNTTNNTTTSAVLMMIGDDSNSIMEVDLGSTAVAATTGAGEATATREQESAAATSEAEEALHQQHQQQQMRLREEALEAMWQSPTIPSVLLAEVIAPKAVGVFLEAAMPVSLSPYAGTAFTAEEGGVGVGVGSSSNSNGALPALALPLLSVPYRYHKRGAWWFRLALNTANHLSKGAASAGGGGGSSVVETPAMKLKKAAMTEKGLVIVEQLLHDMTAWRKLEEEGLRRMRFRLAAEAEKERKNTNPKSHTTNNTINNGGIVSAHQAAWVGSMLGSHVTAITQQANRVGSGGSGSPSSPVGVEALYGPCSSVATAADFPFTVKHLEAIGVLVRFLFTPPAATVTASKPNGAASSPSGEGGGSTDAFHRAAENFLWTMRKIHFVRRADMIECERVYLKHFVQPRRWGEPSRFLLSLHLREPLKVFVRGRRSERGGWIKNDVLLTSKTITTTEFVASTQTHLSATTKVILEVGGGGHHINPLASASAQSAYGVNVEEFSAQWYRGGCGKRPVPMPVKGLQQSILTVSYSSSSEGDGDGRELFPSGTSSSLMNHPKSGIPNSNNSSNNSSLFFEHAPVYAYGSGAFRSLMAGHVPQSSSTSSSSSIPVLNSPSHNHLHLGVPWTVGHMEGWWIEQTAACILRHYAHAVPNRARVTTEVVRVVEEEDGEYDEQDDDEDQGLAASGEGRTQREGEGTGEELAFAAAINTNVGENGSGAVKVKAEEGAALHNPPHQQQQQFSLRYLASPHPLYIRVRIAVGDDDGDGDAHRNHNHNNHRHVREAISNIPPSVYERVVAAGAKRRQREKKRRLMRAQKRKRCAAGGGVTVGGATETEGEGEEEGKGTRGLHNHTNRISVQVVASTTSRALPFEWLSLYQPSPSSTHHHHTLVGQGLLRPHLDLMLRYVDYLGASPPPPLLSSTASTSASTAPPLDSFGEGFIIDSPYAVVPPPPPSCAAPSSSSLPPPPPPPSEEYLSHLRGLRRCAFLQLMCYSSASRLKGFVFRDYRSVFMSSIGVGVGLSGEKMNTSAAAKGEEEGAVHQPPPAPPLSASSSAIVAATATVATVASPLAAARPLLSFGAPPPLPPLKKEAEEGGIGGEKRAEHGAQQEEGAEEGQSPPSTAATAAAADAQASSPTSLLLSLNMSAGYDDDEDDEDAAAAAGMRDLLLFTSGAANTPTAGGGGGGDDDDDNATAANNYFAYQNGPSANDARQWGGGGEGDGISPLTTSPTTPFPSTRGAAGENNTNAASPNASRTPTAAAPEPSSVLLSIPFNAFEQLMASMPIAALGRLLRLMLLSPPTNGYGLKFNGFPDLVGWHNPNPCFLFGTSPSSSSGVGGGGSSPFSPTSPTSPTASPTDRRGGGGAKLQQQPMAIIPPSPSHYSSSRSHSHHHHHRAFPLYVEPLMLLSEVKSPNDSLSEKQLTVNDALLRCGFMVHVLHVIDAGKEDADQLNLTGTSVSASGAVLQRVSSLVAGAGDLALPAARRPGGGGGGSAVAAAVPRRGAPLKAKTTGGATNPMRLDDM